jgi:hypothetical protein
MERSGQRKRKWGEREPKKVAVSQTKRSKVLFFLGKFLCNEDSLGTLGQ